MKYINKSGNEIAGKQIVNKLLEDSWDNIDSYYKGADYEGLCKKEYRIRTVQLMLSEQDNYCCYCMKEIEYANTTLEHIIPHNVNEDDFPKYLVVDELTNNVVYKNDFNRNTKLIPPAKYPHDIAYHNLIASCNSKLHCNNYRKDKKIKPFIYNINIEDIVEYDRAGNISCPQYEDDFQKIGLSNPNSPLKFIRMIWYKLAQNFNHINQITDEIIDDVIYKLISLFDGSKIIENFTSKPSYKDDIIKYDWFFNYYKHN